MYDYIISNVEMGYEYYMNDPRFWRGVIEALDASWDATKKRFAKYNKLNEDIMEENKKRMTKAEAFEYLKAIEDKAYNFWQYVESYFGAPPKE